jgi:undecaprenyl pyrophosphate phosphatase UppP
MSHDPQRQQEQAPYGFYSPHRPYDPQESQPTFISQQSYPPQQAQQSYASGMSSEQRMREARQGKKLHTQLWHGLVRFLGVRGVVVASGAVLAALAFFVLPYYSNYSGYFLAAQTLDDKWWLELILAVLPLAVLIAQQLVPRMKEQQRRLALVVAGSGVLGMAVQYWFMDGVISSNYWRLGTWSYFLGMALVAVGGLLLFFGRVERR